MLKLSAVMLTEERSEPMSLMQVGSCTIAAAAAAAGGRDSSGPPLFSVSLVASSVSGSEGRDRDQDGYSAARAWDGDLDNEHIE